jgi:hypothetical protein
VPPGGAETETVTAVEVLAAKLPAAAYTAVTVFVPAGRAVVFSEAAPPAFNVPVPRVVLPLVKVTVPPGVPAVELTVAVNATLAPYAALAGALRAVEVGAAVTVNAPSTITTL